MIVRIVHLVGMTRRFARNTRQARVITWYRRVLTQIWHVRLMKIWRRTIDMITDFLKDSDTYEKEHLKKSTARPSPKMDVHTIFGDMRRWYEGNVFNHSDYKIDKAKYEMLKAYYDEKEGMADDGK
jgi:hypothetical protein